MDREVITIHVPNFRKWQQPTDKRREWFAIDARFFFDRKVRDARRICDDSPDCFISLWPELDDEGTLEISIDGLTTYWKEVTCSSSNNFNTKKRLNALLKVGLIVVKDRSNDGQTSTKDTFEGAETQVALSKNNTNNTDSSRDDARAFFIAKAVRYIQQSSNPNMHHFGWVAGYLEVKYEEIRNSRPDIPPEAVLQVWQECCDDASAKAIGASKWYRSVFNNRIAEWSPSGTKPFRRPTGSQVPGNQCKLGSGRKGGSGKI